MVSVWHELLREAGVVIEAAEVHRRLNAMMGSSLADVERVLLHEIPEDERAPFFQRAMDGENSVLRMHGGTLYADVESMIARLSKVCTLAVVSNCQDGYIDAFLDAHKMRHYFVAYESMGHSGLPKAENISMVCRHNAMTNPIYIGDTENDWRSATAAEVAFAFVDWGFGSPPADMPDSCRFANAAALCAWLLNE